METAKWTTVKLPTKFPLVPLVQLDWRQVRDFGSREDNVINVSYKQRRKYLFGINFDIWTVTSALKRNIKAAKCYFDVWFRWMGGLQAKSMTSQRYRATYKMADMRYYDNVMTTKIWRLYVILHLQQYSRRLNLFFWPFFIRTLPARPSENCGIKSKMSMKR